jgi:hypothetical protein
MWTNQRSGESPLPESTSEAPPEAPTTLVLEDGTESAVMTGRNVKRVEFALT